MKNQHLFILDTEVIAAADYSSVAGTMADLTEMGLDRLPYDDDVYIQANDTMFGSRVLVYGPLGDACTVKIVDLKTGRSADISGGPEEIRMAAEFTSSVLSDLLVVLLATKNVQKTTTQDKLRKLGIGRHKFKHRFDYTTRIALPRDMEDDADHPPSGGARMPHLRRGHIRRQRHGAGNQQIKKIWIAPMFVNADPDFVSSRKSYDVRIRTGEPLHSEPLIYNGEGDPIGDVGFGSGSPVR